VINRISSNAAFAIQFWILLCMLVLGRIVALVVFNHEWIDSDQTLFWIVAKDYAAGNFHQPFLFGQNYGYAVEALLAVPLIWCQVPAEYALPITTNLLAILPFISFAFFFRKKGQLLAALVLLAIPLLLPASYTLITSMPRGFINGIAVFAVWPWIENVKNVSLRYALYGTVLVAAMAINLNTIFCALLLGGLAFFQSESKIRFVLFAIVGAAIPAALHYAAMSWVTTNHDLLVHHSWELHWNADYFFQTFKDVPFAFFRGVLPLTETCGLITGLIFPVLAVYALIRKKYVYAFLALSVFAAIVFCLSVNKVSDGGMSVFFPRSRMYLALPLVLAILLSGLVNEVRVKSIAILLSGIAVVYSAFQFTRMPSLVQSEVHTTEFIPLYIYSLQGLKSKTMALQNYSDTNSIQFIAGHTNPYSIVELQGLFQAGEVWFDEFPHSALPESERRIWRRNEVLDAPAKSTLWLGGSDEQWAAVDSALGKVQIITVLDMKFRKIDADTVTNRDINHVIRTKIGLYE
jgi:hypothetical protein